MALFGFQKGLWIGWHILESHATKLNHKCQKTHLELKNIIEYFFYHDMVLCASSPSKKYNIYVTHDSLHF